MILNFACDKSLHPSDIFPVIRVDQNDSRGGCETQTRLDAAARRWSGCGCSGSPRLALETVRQLGDLPVHRAEGLPFGLNTMESIDTHEKNTLGRARGSE